MMATRDPPDDEVAAVAETDVDVDDVNTLGSADGDAPDVDGEVVVLGAAVGIAVGGAVIVMTTGAATEAAG